MYFASDIPNTAAVCIALMEEIHKQPGLNWLALIDGAFDYGQKGVSLDNEQHALYDYDGMSDLLAATPVLIKLTSGNADRLRFELATLVRHRKERPMLSFIGTGSSISAVIENFRRFVNVVTDDNQEFLLRFADTRVLPGLSQALRPIVWNAMTCVLTDWIVIDRDGKSRTMQLNSSREPLAGEFRLSAVEFAALVANSEPDAIIDVISESNPEALSEGRRSAIYDKVVASCVFAQKHKVGSFSDLVALAYLALLNDGRGLRNPKLSEMLVRMEWNNGSLINDLINFVE